MLRTRLFSALDASFPVVLVEAAPGAGKRTLLDQWTRVDGASHRLMVDVSKVATDTSGAGLARLICAEVCRALDLPYPISIPSGMEAYGVLVDQLSAASRPVTVALSEADCLTKEAMAALLDIIEVVDGFHLVLSGFDLAHLAEMAPGQASWARLDEQDLFFTPAEVATLLHDRSIAASRARVRAVLDSTGGHPGLVDAAVRQLPDDSAAGTLLPHQPLSAYLTTAPATWPPSFTRILGSLAAIPRLTTQEAHIIAQVECPEATLHRLQLLGLGEITYHPGLGERVFTWHEWVRARLTQTATQAGPPDEGLSTRIRAAADHCGDWELAVASRVRAGDLSGAEEILDNCLWDVLPQVSGAAMWSCMEGITAVELDHYPGLLCLRMRQVHGSPAAATMTAVVVERIGRLVERRGVDPWRRLSLLVRAVVLAQHTTADELLVDQLVRARDLAVDLASADTGGPTLASVSDLLVVVEVLVQTGNTTAAAELAELAITLIAGDPGSLDRAGERRAFAERVRLLSHRERGLADPVAAQNQLTGLQFLQRDADIVIAYLIAIWMAVDDGRLNVADALCRRAMERIQNPTDWPALMWLRLPLLALCEHHAELPIAAADYADSRRRPAGTASFTALSPVHQAGGALMSRAVRADCTLPEFIAPTGSYPRRFIHPRIEYALALDQAVAELRAGRERAARAFLERAIAHVPHHPLSPVALAAATAEEIGRLATLIAEHPAAGKIRFDHAMVVAGYVARPVAELTPREREVLALLREGATNTQMAKALFLSVNTVKSHRASLMGKLGASSRDEVLEMATLMGV